MIALGVMVRRLGDLLDLPGAQRVTPGELDHHRQARDPPICVVGHAEAVAAILGVLGAQGGRCLVLSAVRRCWLRMRALRLLPLPR
jgi:hypothetical protein